MRAGSGSKGVDGGLDRVSVSDRKDPTGIASGVQAQRTPLTFVQDDNGATATDSGHVSCLTSR